jgi:hypothetical protein
MKHTVLRRWPTFALALTAAYVALFPGSPRAATLTPPSVPSELQVSDDQKLYLIGHAVGTQNYVCVLKGTSFTWLPFGPQATLFDDHGDQIATHFPSANPDEGGKPRPTWQHSRDTSAVWAEAVEILDDPAYVEPGAIPWLLLERRGGAVGPNGAHRLAETTFIQRVYTTGGVAPATGCAEAKNVGDKALVPYETEYYFYKPAPGRARD